MVSWVVARKIHTYKDGTPLVLFGGHAIQFDADGFAFCEVCYSFECLDRLAEDDQATVMAAAG